MTAELPTAADYESLMRHAALMDAMTHCPELARLIDEARAVCDHIAYVPNFGHGLYHAVRAFDAVYPPDDGDTGYSECDEF